MFLSEKSIVGWDKGSTVWQICRPISFERDFGDEKLCYFMKPRSISPERGITRMHFIKLYCTLQYCGK